MRPFKQLTKNMEDYKGNNPIFKAIKTLIDIFKSHFPKCDFFMVDFQRRIPYEIPDPVHIFNNEIIIFTNKCNHDPKSYTIQNRFCDYKVVDYSGVYRQICIAGIPYELLTIQRAWRKWFLRKVRERNDPLKQELIAWKYHPSKIDFTI
jgi:hypothetical protein